MEAGGVVVSARAIDVRTLLEDALSMLEPLARRGEVRLVTSAEPGIPAVKVDYERVLRVFSNLVVNAVKFSPRESEVMVKAEWRDETIRFSVTDSGAGIAPEHLPHLFDRFWQADGRDRRGIGLGLAIAKAIVVAHGGTIGVTSTLGIGSTFCFELPIA